MWVFLKDAFFSIVEDRNDRGGRLMVRARFPGDIERHFPGVEVIDHAPGEADYRFRAFIDRQRVVGVIADQVAGIGYVDFKSQVSPDENLRYQSYLGCWSQLNRAQHNCREYGMKDLLDGSDSHG